MVLALESDYRDISMCMSFQLFFPWLSARAFSIVFISMLLSHGLVRIDNFVANKWVPTFMEKFVESSDLLQDLEKEKDNSAKLRLLIEFNVTGVSTIVKSKEELKTKWRNKIKPLRERLSEHYEMMAQANDTLIKFLHSAEKHSKMNEKMISLLKKPITEIISIDESEKQFLEILESADKTSTSPQN